MVTRIRPIGRRRALIDGPSAPRTDSPARLGRPVVATAVLVAATLLSACGLRTLKRDLEIARAQASVEGRAEVRGEPVGPIVVVAERAGTGQVADLFLLARPGPYLFTLPPGSYRLAAFADRSRDLTYQPDVEPAALLGTSGEVALEPGARRRDVDLTIDATAGARIPFGVTALAEDQRIAQVPSLQIGAVAQLDDPRFAPENGSVGLWDPIRFMLEVGGGIYFLEPYDPQKIPVLFVHGATGTPADWKHLAASVDRSRFQPWFAYYPGAPALDRVGNQLVRALSSLVVRYRFDRLVLVAHSMGGLVTRAALNAVAENVSGPRQVSVPLFVSISSPWGGHPGATLGVRYAPVVAPMWVDMSPGSAFLTSLLATPLPPETEYDLLFSYRSDSRLGDEANDGAITVASQLPLSMQRQARHVVGFDETHTSILESAAVADTLNAMLEHAAR
jgi:pimeloyl-ACP methyl ester carboxylesterase